MSKNSLLKLASKFEAKLGISPKQTKTAEVSLPKSLKKIANAEKTFQTKLAAHQAKFMKLTSGPSVKCSSGLLPAEYHVCETCQGQGKLAVTRPDPNVKFASTEEYLGQLVIKKCDECKGKRVIKAVDDSQCSESQLMVYAAEKEAKESKKAAKALKKAEKAEKKAAEKKLALEDPEKYAALKTEKKEGKSKKKAEKKAKKAEKKAVKAKAKAAKYFGKAKKDDKNAE